jgi:hypothetical protein
VTVTERRYETFAEAYGDGDASSASNPVFGLIRWARTYRPTIATRDLARIQAMVDFLVREHDDVGDIRGKEAYLRVAFTIARLNHQALTPRHFLWAIELVEGSHSAVDELADQFNVSRPERKDTGIE